MKIAGQQGMTLLEILLATALISIVATMAFVGLNSLIEARLATDERSDKINRLNLTLQMMRTDVQYAMTSLLDGQARAQLAAAEFTGANNGFTLQRYHRKLLKNNESSNNGDVIQVKWHLRGKKLLRSTQSVLTPAYRYQWQDREMIELERFSCSYIGQNGLSVFSWPQTILDRSQLPTSIKCQLQTTKQQTTELIMFPMQNS
ncbi:MAG: prepilin-type N-terminal cleavage/methylation domain-containing protein [Proteobacteria bacterium]|nr:prepilin-type N-terminal cleavage/methylation domain-containing protein [Pseudomonadota bacterium]